jgi:hypothetical protein
LDGNETRNHRPFAREDEAGYSVWLHEVGPTGLVDGNSFLPVVYDEQAEAAAKRNSKNKKQQDRPEEEF